MMGTFFLYNMELSSVRDEFRTGCTVPHLFHLHFYATSPGVGYAVGYHLMVEAQGNADISTTEEFRKRILEYEIPKPLPRGANQT